MLYVLLVIYISETVQTIINACVVLHNFALQRNEPPPVDDGSVEIQQIKRHEIIDRRISHLATNQIDPRGIKKRHEIIATFFDN